VPREDLFACIRAVNSGKTYVPPGVAAKLAGHLIREELTARELEVLALIAKGEANKRIARELSLSEGTVKSHVKNILGKLDAASRTEAVAIAHKRGLITL
jgi:DNA-binding NarL/FixJ family response regulator